MIEMSCPRCGAGGRVPREKVNSRLVCRKCLQVFHLSPSLQPVIGEPPAPKEVLRQRVQRERVELELPGLERLGGLGEKLAKVKLPDAKTLGITAGVLLAIGFCWWLFSKQSVEQRSNVLAASIRKLDLDAAVAMAMPGTEMEAMKWVGDVYKQYLDLKLNIGNLEPGVKIQVQQNSDGTAQSLMEFSREGAMSSGPLTVEQAATLEPQSSETKKSMQLVIYWDKDTWGTWRLDGKRTTETSTQPH
jgi:hypothetical protein